jgi:hypothetical protein
MQHAFAEHMTDPQTWLSLAAFYQRKRDLLQNLLVIHRSAAAERRFILPAGGLQPFQRGERQRHGETADY